MDENYNWVGRWRRKSGGPCKTDLRLSAFLQGWYWLIFMPTCHFLAKVSLSRSQWGELRWEKTRPKISTPFYLIPAVLQSQPLPCKRKPNRLMRFRPSCVQTIMICDSSKFGHYLWGVFQVMSSNPIMVEDFHSGVWSGAKMEQLCIGVFASLGRLCHRSFFFFLILRASRVLEAWFRLKTMTAVDALSFLLIQTDAPGYWNRTDVSPLYGKSLWEQLCMSNFACYEILIPLFFCHLEQSTVFYPYVSCKT